MNQFNKHPSQPGQRAGLSLVEYVGCLVAVVGGMWIGAVWLGVDIERVTYKTLDESKLIEKLPAQWRPANPDGEFSHDEIAESLRTEMVALRDEIGALRDVSQAQVAASAQPEVAVRRENTQLFWNTIREIATDEAALQKSADSALTEANLDRVYATRSRVSRFASKAVRTTPEDLVDEEVVAFSRELANWYDRTASLYDQAAEIWSSPAVQRSQARFTERWSTSEKQRQNEASLLVDKATALRASLQRRYGGQFLPFGG